MNLADFKKFSSYVPQVNKKEEVWSYTRVSSKEQFDNNKSLENQQQYAKDYAEKNGLKITKEFGGTYESAKGDFTRKEFTEMIRLVRQAKVKPYAILIYKMSRFSRSGSGGISVVHELIEGLGVHLIETGSNLTTETPRSKNTLIGRLVDAEKENLERLEYTIPGMVRLLKEGNWLGHAPFGYDHYGPRVHDLDKLSREQKIVLNDKGKLLKMAWKWKLEGIRDFEILKKLEPLGLKLSKQKLSVIWRNPFYAGINVHRLLKGDAVQGNWEKMVSHQDFLKVQQILLGNNAGYSVSKIHPSRPLMGFLECLECGGKLTGYEVKSKKLHYYTCQNKCNGSSMNAETTPKALTEGLNNSFIKFLQKFELHDELEDVFRLQLQQSIMAFNEDNSVLEKKLKNEISNIELKINKLEEKHIFGDLPLETYHKYLHPLQIELAQMKKEVSDLGSKISNQENLIEKCVNISKNLSKYWGKCDIETKLRIQELVFPSGMVIDAKKRQYLTKEINSIFAKIPVLSKDTEGQKKDASEINPDASCLVAGTRLERATFGL